MAGACREEIEHLDDEPGDQEIGVDKKKGRWVPVSEMSGPGMSIGEE